MAKPVSAPPPVEDDQVEGPASEEKAADSSSPACDDTRRDWLDERIREEYLEAADEPLPPRLLALLRKLRPSIH